MIDNKKKLVELLVDFNMETNAHICDDCGRRPVSEACAEIADHLIANGVTFHQEQFREVTKMVTNADRIRAMSDEELAEFLESTHSNMAIKLGGEYIVRAKEYITLWLQQPAEEVHHD